ncbi:hypothetical protein DZA29_15110 [Citrobacter gillenii]|nr:hypothetical protein DZA29_15110 [Citrobacter gillenii]
MCVGCTRSPQSLTLVSSWGFAPLPPSCNSNYLGYRFFRNGVRLICKLEKCVVVLQAYITR